MEQQRKAKAKKEAEEAQVLVDEDDDAVQQLLRSEIEPTLDLDEFIAHSGVVPPAGDSIPAQVEAVYRDINSMIDTLGLNARSLRAYTSGHREFHSDQHTKQDIASPDAWTLGDIEQLTFIINHVLGQALDEAKVTDVEEKIAQVQDMQRDLARDCNKQADLRKTIASRLDPEQAATYQSLPLSAEQAAQQSDLRRQLGHFQTLLAQAEESLTLLKAKIVSVNSVSGRGGPVPTIEAIVRTITKMTSMVEKRSGDIDVLENQMRKLRLGSVGPAGSHEGSPFATPTAKKALGSSIFSPERSTREGTPLRGSIMRRSLSGSISATGGDIFRTPPRRKLSGFGDAEKRAVKEKRERRAAVLGKLRNSIQNKGLSVIAMDDIA
jgi:nucleoporin NUP159